jgi:hypothetical protein
MSARGSAKVAAMVSAVVPTRRSLLGVLTLLAACGGTDAQPDPDALGGSGLAAPLDGAISAPPPQDDAGAPTGQDAGAPAPLDAGVPGDAGLPVSCPVAAPTACADPTAIRYADIAPIIEARCAPCHSPLWSGPWPLHTLGHVRDWTEDIRTNLLACTMPPLDAGIPITKEERLTILQWIRCGTPE